jgi:hypothetical protein
MLERGMRSRPPISRRCGLALLIAVSAVTLVPASAPAVQGDAAATRAYIQADYRLVRTGVSAIPRIEATLHKVLAGVRAECPMAAAGSPQNPQSTQLSDEVIGDMVLSVVALDRPAGRAFVNDAGHLAWSDRALTRTIQSYVGKVKVLVAMPHPKLCSDVKSWAATGFTTLPASTLVFSPRFMSAWVALGELPAGLARYATPEDRTLFVRTRRLEEQFTDLEAREVETYAQIMNPLGLSP